MVAGVASEDELQAEEFQAFAAYVEDNLRTQAERAQALSGEAPVDFLTELDEEPDVVGAKVRQLAELVRQAKHFVIYTGARDCIMRRNTGED